MKRLDDWRHRLTAYMAASARRPFRMGRHDCSLFAAGAVKAMTGKDIARGFRGYRTYKGGLKKARQKGFKDHVAIFASHFEEVPIALARLGDVAVIETEEGPAVGIVQGEHIYTAAQEGLALMPLLSAARAFRV